MLPLINGRPKGMLPAAWEEFKDMGITADRVVQTEGDAPLSRGTHGPDGTFKNELGHEEVYSAAVDLSVHHPEPWSKADVDSFLGKAADHGFAGYHRVPGRDGWPAGDAEHIHMVYAGTPMKDALKNQVHDWLADKTGLKGHGQYTEWQPSTEQQQAIRTLFLAHNPA